MTDEHKKALAEGRKKYWNKYRTDKEEFDPCVDCATRKFLAKWSNTEVDTTKCTINCRYNKENNNDGNNE